MNPVSSFLCDKSAQVCETFLYIDHYLTMFNHNAPAVNSGNGKLYSYNVTNISPLFSYERRNNRRLLEVKATNYTQPGPDIIVYEGQTIVIHVENYDINRTKYLPSRSLAGSNFSLFKAQSMQGLYFQSKFLSITTCLVL